MAVPADRFRAMPDDAIGLRLPPSLTDHAAGQRETPVLQRFPTAAPPLFAAAERVDVAVEVDRVVPPSGNLTLARAAVLFGPIHAGTTITLRADTTVVHLLRNGERIKTVPSRLTLAQIGQLVVDGGRPAAPTLVDSRANGPIEVERLVNGNGPVCLAGRQHSVGYHLAGQRVTVRLDGAVMQILDLERTLLRSLPTPVTEPHRLLHALPGGPPPSAATYHRNPLRCAAAPSPRPYRMAARIAAT